MHVFFFFFFQTSLDWSVWGSSLGQKLLEWIAEQERKTRFAAFNFHLFIITSLSRFLIFFTWFMLSCWLCPAMENNSGGCSISRYDMSHGLDNKNLHFFFLNFWHWKLIAMDFVRGVWWWRSCSACLWFGSIEVLGPRYHSQFPSIIFLTFDSNDVSINNICCSYIRFDRSMFLVAVNKLWGEAQGNGGSIKRRIHWILEKVDFQLLITHDNAFPKLFLCLLYFWNCWSCFLLYSIFIMQKKQWIFSRSFKIPRCSKVFQPNCSVFVGKYKKLRLLYQF